MHSLLVDREKLRGEGADVFLEECTLRCREYRVMLWVWGGQDKYNNILAVVYN